MKSLWRVLAVLFVLLMVALLSAGGVNAQALSAVFTGSISGTVLTVTAITNGALGAGQSVFGSTVAANTVIQQQLSGASGNIGTYQVAPSQTAGTQQMRSAASSNSYLSQVILGASLQAPPFSSSDRMLYVAANGGNGLPAIRSADPTQFVAQAGGLKIDGSNAASAALGAIAHAASGDVQTTASIGIQNALRVWVGTFQPPISAVIPITTANDNLGGRAEIWVGDAIQTQLPVSQGGGIGIAHGLELNNVANLPVNTPTSAFTQGPALHGLEIVANAGSTFNPHVGSWYWSADDNPTEWWNFDIGCTRTVIACIVAEHYPGDTHNEFSTAVLWDKSNSAAMLKMDGGARVFLNMTGMTSLVSPFVQAPSIIDANLLIQNPGNHAMGIQLDSGSTAAEDAYLLLSDRLVPYYKILKNVGDDFQIRNMITGNGIFYRHTDDYVLFPAGIIAAQLPTSGTATGSLCRQSDGSFFVKTTPGACL